MSCTLQSLAIILAIFAWNANSFSEQFLGNMKHPELPDHCYHEEFNISVPINQTIYPTNLETFCFKIYCREDFVLHIKHCDRVMAPRYCVESTHDYNKPYPQCCPVIKCKNDI